MSAINLIPFHGMDGSICGGKFVDKNNLSISKIIMSDPEV